jgi:hypothetical protein
MQAIIISVLVLLWLGTSPCLASKGDNPSSTNPPLPKEGIRVIPPNPQLPAEVRAFSGVWEGTYSHYTQPQKAEVDYQKALLIVEEIVSPEKVRVLYSVGRSSVPHGWMGGNWSRYEATISEVNGSYSLSFQKKDGGVHTFNLKGDKLVSWFGFDRNKYFLEMTRRPDQPATDRLAASPPLPPEGIKITPPNQQLPAEIRAFSGTWEGTWGLSSEREPGQKDFRRATLIVEEIVSPEKVRVVYSWGPAASGDKPGWGRYWGSISREKDRYVLSYKRPNGKTRSFALAGDQLLTWDVESKYEIKMSRRAEKP